MTLLALRFLFPTAGDVVALLGWVSALTVVVLAITREPRE